MSIATRWASVWRRFGEFAAAMDYSPTEALHERLVKLEAEVAMLRQGRTTPSANDGQVRASRVGNT